ncbi:MAG: hypothetical protein C0598_11995 [Marinilabiliales bacterium]|nr:MAG: hypothetical protein C0598_11995 [Marinilabiliales bacterium]
MKTKFLFLFAAVILMVLGSCNSTIYFTQEMRNELNNNSLNVEDVQFYTSKKLVLKRNLTYDETKIARGEIKIENGQYVEEIIIPKNTPGVAVNFNSKRIDVAFERGDNRDLKFMVNDDNLYQITALSWNNEFGKVQYDTLFYHLVPGSDKTYLKVKKDNIYKFQKNKRVLKGRTVGN